MFRRSSKRLPKDPHFEPDLKKLGYKLTEEGEFVKTGEDGTAGQAAGEHFEYSVSKDDRYNEAHKNAFYDAMQNAVLEKLRTLGIEELFLAGDKGTKVVENRPKSQHVSILTTRPLATLASSRNVIIVIGDSSDELGIWSHRLLKGKLGLQTGSAVGLAGKIAESAGRDASESSDAKQITPSTPPTSAEERSSVPKGGNVVISANSDPPALVILNPGQLHYSMEHKKTMSIRMIVANRKSYVRRSRPWSGRGKYLGGHWNNFHHTATVFEYILPDLLSHRAQLFVIGIADGASAFVSYMNIVSRREYGTSFANQVKAFATIQPTFRPNDITSEAMKSWMLHRSRSWVLSNLPKLTFLSAPGAYDPIEGITLSTDTMAQKMSSSTENPATPETANSDTDGEPQIRDRVPDSDMPNDEERAEFDYYSKEPVASPTFSSGVSDHVENIWPTVMDNVLDYFRSIAEVEESLADRGETGCIPIALDMGTNVDDDKKEG